jgi:D-sedoheptulose 7-phosphate isomerase
MNRLDQIFTQDAAQFSRSYLDYVCEVLRAIRVDEIAAFARTLLEARGRGAAIYFIGNGGSAATAAHFANDLAIGTNCSARPFRALSLCDNQAVVTAIANDFGYEHVFSRQLQVLGRPGDVLVAISASGNSPNLLRAVEYAQRSDIRTVGITAFDGGQLRKRVDQSVHVPTGPKEYGPAEDAHMVLDHLLGAYLLRLTHGEG